VLLKQEGKVHILERESAWNIRAVLLRSAAIAW